MLMHLLVFGEGFFVQINWKYFHEYAISQSACEIVKVDF